MNKYAIWDLEKYKVDEPNKYSDVVDKEVFFDYRHRERAIDDLFESTKDPEVKQVLVYAMELNNKYRSEAMELYLSLERIKKLLKKTFREADTAFSNTYL